MVGSAFLSSLDPSIRVTRAARSLGRDLHSVCDWAPRDITAILHCAADTRFDRTLEDSRFANVTATRRLLDLAQELPRLERFGYVSTAYACGWTTGELAESRWPRAARYSNPYQQSKWEAEELVMESGLPCSLYRLSTIISASDGVVTQYNYAHQLLRLLERRILPVMPGDPDVRLDLIYSDWAAEALRHAFLASFTPGRIWNLCAGPSHSLTVQELIDGAGGGAPRFIPLDEWEDLGRATPDKLLRELIRVLSFTLPHFALDQRFVTSHGLALPDPRPLIPGIAAQSRVSGRGQR